ncbi:unnamed protein product [Phaeothamnion confervicola]
MDERRFNDESLECACQFLPSFVRPSPAYVPLRQASRDGRRQGADDRPLEPCRMACRLPLRGKPLFFPFVFPTICWLIRFTFTTSLCFIKRKRTETLRKRNWGTRRLRAIYSF